MEGVCTWCLLALTLPSTQLQIMGRGGLDETERAMFDAAYRDVNSGSLARKAEIIDQANGMEWDVILNGQRVGPPVTTWHGDPICEAHLYGVAQREREPQTVRMAQWKR